MLPQIIDQVNLGQLAPGDFFGEREQSGGVCFVEGRGDAARGTVVVHCFLTCGLLIGLLLWIADVDCSRTITPALTMVSQKNDYRRPELEALLSNQAEGRGVVRPFYRLEPYA